MESNNTIYTTTAIPASDYYNTVTTGTSPITYFTYEPATVSITTTAIDDSKDSKEKEKKEIQNPFDKKIRELLIQARKGNDGIYFSNIKEYVPGKVYEFTLSHSPTSIFEPTKIKTVCDETDIFDLDLAFYLALSKHYYSKELTPEGYLREAKNFQYEKKMIKKVSYGKKLFKLLQEKEAWETEQEELKKARHKKYVEKKIARKKKKEQKEDDRLTNVIKRAIKED